MRFFPHKPCIQRKITKGIFFLENARKYPVNFLNPLAMLLKFIYNNFLNK